MPDGMSFQGALGKINNVLEALDSGPAGDRYELKRQELWERLQQTTIKFNEMEEGVVPRSLFLGEEYQLIREGLGGSKGNRIAYEAVMRADGDRIDRFVDDIEDWVNTFHNHFIGGDSTPPPSAPGSDILVRVIDDALSHEEAITGLIDRAVDAKDPCFEHLREWVEVVWSKLREYRSYPAEDLHESYGILAAQIEHLGFIADKVGAPNEVLTAINNLLDEIGGPWRNRERPSSHT